MMVRYICMCVGMDVILCGCVCTCVCLVGVDFVSVDLDLVLLIGRFFFLRFAVFVVVGWQLIFSLNIFSFHFFLFDKTFSLISQRAFTPLSLVPSTLLVTFTSQMSALAAAVASL